MAHKFATVKGTSTLVTSPYYIGLVQHTSSMSRKETYAHLSEELGFTGANIKSVFIALAKVLKENAGKGNDAVVDNVARFKVYCQGAFAGSTGPWVKGVNALVVNALEAEPVRKSLAGIVPENVTEGLAPAITSVLDTVTGEYDAVTGTDLVSIGGTNLGLDTTKSDEYVGILWDDGTLDKMTVSTSTVTQVMAKFDAAPDRTGKAKLVIATRCGMGEEYGVKVASRIVEVK